MMQEKLIHPNANPVILLNGPPRSGKNTVFQVLDGEFYVIELALAESVAAATHAMFGLAEMEIEIEHMEADKDTPKQILGGISWRQAKINTGEIMKAVYGQGFWAQTVCRKIRELDLQLKRSYKNNFLICVTDVGFPHEIEAFEKEIGKRSVLLRLHRTNLDFGKNPDYEQAYGRGTGKDSRNWVFSDVIPSFDLSNDGTLEDFRHDIVQTLKPVMHLRVCVQDRNSKAWNVMQLSKSFKAHDPAKIALQPFNKPYTIVTHEIKEVLTTYDPVTKKMINHTSRVEPGINE